MAKSKTTKKQASAKVAIKAVSVDKMLDENLNAVHTSDYQTYLRKLMHDAARKF